MARVFGSLPLNAAEKAVTLALKEQLPAECTVIPGVRWAVGQGGYVRDGEADAVVLWPGLGMLVIEVKGSREIRISERGWERLEGANWVLLDRSPVDQATENAHQIVRILCDRRVWGDFPGCHGWFAVYPNGEANQVPQMFDATTIATRRDMQGLHKKVRAALEARGPASRREKFSDGISAACLEVLAATEFRIVRADGGEEVSADLDAIDMLTQQQSAALHGLFDLPSVAVSGAAGSGKTILAIWRLGSVLAAGQSGIYVCYNRRLAEALRLRHPELAPHIHSIDSLLGRACPGLQRGSDVDRFHRELLPNAAFDAVSGWGDADKFDAVLVDEAQDLSEEQVTALFAYKKETGTWALFMDKRQDVYDKRLEDSFCDVTYRLMHNCRNATKINAATNKCMEDNIPSMPGMPEGMPVAVERVRKAQMANRALQIAATWKQGADVSVAVLSPYSRANSALSNVQRAHGLEVSEQLQDLPSRGRVFFSTVKSFKGIEADCIVLVDAPAPSMLDVAFGKQDLYVACTRAKTRLVILSGEEAWAREYKEIMGLPEHVAASNG